MIRIIIILIRIILIIIRRNARDRAILDKKESKKIIDLM
jgi:hypothetical protein